MNYSGFQLGHPEITLPNPSKTSLPSLYKLWMILQRGIAGLALLFLLPLIGLMWLGIKATSPGKFLFAQERPGLDGGVFKVYKVRTMHPGNEANTALGVTRCDPRVTALGKIFRALKLDELPQLWNILCGHMTLVGPRPIPVALDCELRRSIPGFEQRYQVHPGLTSLGQICVQDNSLGDGLVDDWTLRFQGELHYIRNRCIRYDLLIIFMTIIYVGKMLIHKIKSSRRALVPDDIKAAG